MKTTILLLCKVLPLNLCPFRPRRVALICYSGDSCHPMLPYLAQGANSALEDGAVLGLLLQGVKTQPQLAEALERFEKLRKDRGERIAREAFEQVSEPLELTQK